MYCRNCGNKLLDADKFCNNCGSKVIPDERNSKEIKFETKEEVINQEIKAENNEKKLPMNWWNFFLYVKFPLTIIALLYSIINAFHKVQGLELNTFGQGIIIAFFIIDIIFLLYTVLSFYIILKRKQKRL